MFHIFKIPKFTKLLCLLAEILQWCAKLWDHILILNFFSSILFIFLCFFLFIFFHLICSRSLINAVNRNKCKSNCRCNWKGWGSSSFLPTTVTYLRVLLFLKDLFVFYSDCRKLQSGDCKHRFWWMWPPLLWGIVSWEGLGYLPTRGSFLKLYAFNNN